MAQENLILPPAPRKPRANPVPLPFQARLKVRNLYLSQGLGCKAIAERCGLTPTQVQNLISREKLTAIRKQRENGIIRGSDSRAQNLLEQFNSELAEQAEEISLGALQRARNEIDVFTPESPRNFQSLTGGIANLVKAARSVRGLDAKGGGPRHSDGSTIIFIGALERVGDAAKAASQAQAQPMKQAEKAEEVTEISAKLIPA